MSDWKQISIDGKPYTVDMDNALERKGVLQSISDITAGDLFKVGNLALIVVQSGYDSQFWNILSADCQGFRHFADFGAQGVVKDELIRWLRERNFTFVKNLNADLIRLVHDITNCDDANIKEIVVDRKVFTEELKFVDLDSEQWKAARDKNQSLLAALASVHEPGHLINVTLPQDVMMPFCFIPAGSFTMGSPEDEKGRDDQTEKQVKVTLSKNFLLGQTEVTQAQWKSVMSSNLSHAKGLNLPVEFVSWDDAQAFITKLNQNKILPEGLEFALPTEAQWEYACRAGETGPYSGGTLDEVGWYTGNSADKTHQVGQKKPNAWGLHDMHGNVCEWCVDEFFSELKGGIDPVGSDPENLYGCRVVRGGSYCRYDDYEDAHVIDYRAANRWLDLPSQRWANFGFRVAIVSSK